jgi:hypothetical protein
MKNKSKISTQEKLTASSISNWKVLTAALYQFGKGSMLSIRAITWMERSLLNNPGTLLCSAL